MNKLSITQQAKTSSFLPHAHGILQRKCACENHTPGGKACSECSKEGGTPIQRSAFSNQPMNGVSPTASRIQQSASDGIRVDKSNEKRGLSPIAKGCC